MILKCDVCGSHVIDYARFVSDNDLGYIDALKCYDCEKVFETKELKNIIVKGELDGDRSKSL